MGSCRPGARWFLTRGGLTIVPLTTKALALALALTNPYNMHTQHVHHSCFNPPPPPPALPPPPPYPRVSPFSSSFHPSPPLNPVSYAAHRHQPLLRLPTYQKGDRPTLLVPANVHPPPPPPAAANHPSANPPGFSANREPPPDEPAVSQPHPNTPSTPAQPPMTRPPQGECVVDLTHSLSEDQKAVLELGLGFAPTANPPPHTLPGVAPLPTTFQTKL